MIRLLLICSILFVANSVATAEIVYEVFYRINGDDVIDAEYFVSPDTTLEDVELVFRESSNSADDVVLFPNGIKTSAVALQASDLGWLSNPTDNAALVLGLNGTFGSVVPIGGSTFFDAAPVTTVNDAPTNRVYEFVIGNVDISGPSAGQSRVFNIRQYDPDVPQYLAPANDQDQPVFVDSITNFRGMTLTAVAVPEPSTALALLGGLGCLVASTRRRRR